MSAEAVIGVELEIEEPEGAVIRRIFEMYANGAGLAQIAKILNAESVLAPRPSSARAMRA